ncbi:MAG: rhodanese-like domain-containing protein [Planctomycetota bacterium]|jgi:rhodanese-related sulfurtransferase
MKALTRDELKGLLESSEPPVVLDVLPSEYYEESHLPGALHAPLDEHFAQHVQQIAPDHRRPLVVYCMNRQCTASLHAAETLDALGYEHVLEYEDGKTDWQEAGLPLEKTHLETLP